MRTIKFGDLDSYEDLGLVRKDVEIGAPKPKTDSVEVEGADGVLDLTEYFGEVLYDNRTIKMEFYAEPTSESFHEVFEDLYNKLHGKKMHIALSEEPGFYYVGRVTLDKWKTNDKTGAITISADCEPYRYKAAETVKAVTVSGTKTETFSNLRKRVVPAFELSAAMQIKQGTSTYSASQGTWSDNRLYFVEGDNQLEFTGTGTVTVKYQERGL